MSKRRKSNLLLSQFNLCTITYDAYNTDICKKQNLDKERKASEYRFETEVTNRLRSIAIVWLIGILTLQSKYGYTREKQSDISSLDDLPSSRQNLVETGKWGNRFGNQDKIFQKLRVHASNTSPACSDGSSSDGELLRDDSDAYKSSTNEVDPDTPTGEDVWNELVNKISNIFALSEMDIDAANDALRNQNAILGSSNRLLGAQ